MKFKEGNSVEVLRREDPCGSWFSGEIISADVDTYIVRYELLMDHDGEPVLEKVSGEYVRPQPPHENEKRWMVGDVAEVFDIHSWRVGKVAKVLKNKHFVIRLFGSIQVQEFHESNLRIRQVWHNNKWSIIGKVGRNRLIANNLMQNNLNYVPNLACGEFQQGICEETCLREEDEIPQGPIFQGPYYSVRSSKDPLIGGCRERRKSSLNARGYNKHLIRTLPLFKQVEDISSVKVRVDEKFMTGYTRLGAKMNKRKNYSLHSSPKPLSSSEDSNQCSVASCSFNEFADYPGQNSQKSLEKISDSSDAESTFPSLYGEKHLPPPPGEKLEADIHKLELRAYKSTMQALHASGPLSWEQESLLTNLRLSLHISNEEHLLQLRHLLSTQVL